MGLVAYRDRGDAYVTQVVDLNRDLDSMYAKLMDFRSRRRRRRAGSRQRGARSGDSPHVVEPGSEHVQGRVPGRRCAAAHGLSGRREVPADRRCGGREGHRRQHDPVRQHERHGRAVAAHRALGRGRYFTVEQAGSAVAIETPFDAQIATLAAELDGTRLYYGSAEQQRAMAAKVDATTRLDRRGLRHGARAPRRVQRQRSRRRQLLGRARARRRRRERPRRPRRRAAGAAARRRRRAAGRGTARAAHGNGAEARGAASGRSRRSPRSATPISRSRSTRPAAPTHRSISRSTTPCASKPRRSASNTKTDRAFEPTGRGRARSSSGPLARLRGDMDECRGRE